MFDWKILKITIDNDAIIHAEYVCKLINEPYQVNSTGNWYFSDKTVKIPLEEVKETDIVDWILQESMQDGVSTIELQLEQQIKFLQNEQPVDLPWLPKKFKLRI